MKDGSVTVKVGNNVKQGHNIGLVGNTGRSFGAHLHFEVFKGTTTASANAIDPVQFYKMMGGTL